MTKSRVIKVITDSGTSTYVGLDADNHLSKLELDTTDTEFVEEVNRKLTESKEE